MTSETYARTFAAAFTRHDAAALARGLADDGTLLTLTGQWAQGPVAAQHAFAAEFSGIFANARLVTGKNTVRVLAPQITLIHQRYVVTGARDEQGSDLPRFAAMLVAVLQALEGDFRALSLTFVAVP